MIDTRSLVLSKDHMSQLGRFDLLVLCHLSDLCLLLTILLVFLYAGKMSYIRSLVNKAN